MFAQSQQQIEEELEIVLSKCSSNISYSSIPILRLYSMNSADDEIYKRIHQKFLKTSDMYSSILVISQKLVEKTNLDQDLVLLLLHKYKWSEDKLQAEYFQQQNQDEYQQKLIKKKKSHIQESIEQCPICQHKKPMYYPTCGHGACQECWRQYINAQLVDKAFFKCMNEQCNDTLYHSFVMKIFEPKNKYLRRLSLQYGQSVKSISSCPGVDCELFFEDTSLLVKSVLCECGTRYCFKCKAEPHQPCSCVQVQEWNKLTKSQKPNETWIKSNTKICPGCKNPIERALGCNLIACKCGVHFCYNCGNIWDESHKDHFVCPSKLNKNKSKTGEDQVSSITSAYSKFIVSNFIEKNAEKEYQEMDLFRKQVFSKLLVPENDTLFIKLLSNILVRGYNYIKWTQVLQYFKRDLSSNEDILQFGLQKLRGEMQRCSYLMTDLKSKLDAVISQQNGQIVSNKGAILKKFYHQKQTIEKVVKQTQTFIGQYLSDIKNV